MEVLKKRTHLAQYMYLVEKAEGRGLDGSKTRHDKSTTTPGDIDEGDDFNRALLGCEHEGNLASSQLKMRRIFRTMFEPYKLTQP